MYHSNFYFFRIILISMTENLSIRLEAPLDGYIAAGLDGQASYWERGDETIKVGEALLKGEPLGALSEEGEEWIGDLSRPAFFMTPEGCVSEWPGRLFKVRIPRHARISTCIPGGFLAECADVVSEEPSELLLGPQRDILLGMALRAMVSTPDEIERMAELNEDGGLRGQAALEVRALSRARGRHNTMAIQNLMWAQGNKASPHDWRTGTPLFRAAFVVAHRDLMTPIQAMMYEEMLLEPWIEVMGEPAPLHLDAA